jgi:hypothetical protein
MAEDEFAPGHAIAGWPLLANALDRRLGNAVPESEVFPVCLEPGAGIRLNDFDGSVNAGANLVQTLPQRWHIHGRSSEVQCSMGQPQSRVSTITHPVTQPRARPMCR